MESLLSVAEIDRYNNENDPGQINIGTVKI